MPTPSSGNANTVNDAPQNQPAAPKNIQIHLRGETPQKEGKTFWDITQAKSHSAERKKRYRAPFHHTSQPKNGFFVLHYRVYNVHCIYCMYIYTLYIILPQLCQIQQKYFTSHSKCIALHSHINSRLERKNLNRISCTNLAHLETKQFNFFSENVCPPPCPLPADDI